MIMLLFLSFSCHALFDEYAASQLIKDNQWQQVQQLFENKVTENPQDARSLFSAGVAAFKQKDLDRAHSLFSRAAELNDSIAEKSLFNVGNIEMINKKYQEAVDAYEGVLKINPENQRARERLELARQMLQQPPEEDKSQQDKNDKNNEDKKDNSDQKDSENSENNNDKQQNQDNSTGEDADDEPQNGDQKDKQQKNQEKGQNDRRRDNKKDDRQQKQNSGQDEHEKAESQTAQQKKEQDIQGQNKESDHNSSNNGSKDQSNDIAAKDQWKQRLFSDLDKVEENSHKDMMQVVYAAQAPQDHSPNW